MQTLQSIEKFIIELIMTADVIVTVQKSNGILKIIKYLRSKLVSKMYENYRHKMFSKRFELRPQLPRIQMAMP